jgi:hypothetical protein
MMHMGQRWNDIDEGETEGLGEKPVINRRHFPNGR